MKHTTLQSFTDSAYTLFRSTSEHSNEDKAFQFAAFVAHEVASDLRPGIPADVAACLATQAMLTHLQNSQHYSAVRASRNLEFQHASNEQKRARTPWLHAPRQAASRAETASLSEAFERLHETPAIPSTQINLAQALSGQDQATQASTMNTYFHAFPIAYLAFEQASKTNTEEDFKQQLEATLTEGLGDPFSSLESFFSCLCSTEMAVFMGVVLLIGLFILALPSLGFILLPAATTYAIGGSLTFSGSAFHLWRACTSIETEDEPAEEACDLLSPCY